MSTRFLVYLSVTDQTRQHTSAKITLLTDYNSKFFLRTISDFSVIPINYIIIIIIIIIISLLRTQTAQQASIESDI